MTSVSFLFIFHILFFSQVNDKAVVLPAVAYDRSALRFNRPINLGDQIQVGKNELSIKWKSVMDPNIVSNRVPRASGSPITFALKQIAEMRFWSSLAYSL